MSSAQELPTFRCVLFGEGGTGKSTFVKRFISGEFDDQHLPTNEEHHQLTFHTNYGTVSFSIFETRGQHFGGHLSDCNFQDYQCAIILYDVTARITYKHVSNWLRDLEDQCDNIPVVICGTKVDLVGRYVLPRHFKFKQRDSLRTYFMSAKSNFNIKKPFMWLMSQLLGCRHIRLIEEPALMPREAKMVRGMRSKIKHDLKKARKTLLPDNGDDHDDDDVVHSSLLNPPN